MELDIRSRHLPFPAALQAYCERRLSAALGRFEGSVRRVVARAGRVPGRRGGSDVRFTVVVLLREGPLAVTEARDADLTAAMDRAAARAGQAVARTLCAAGAHGWPWPARPGRTARGPADAASAQDAA
jgi:ribosome-associated translation inhibitor RaiA